MKEQSRGASSNQKMHRVVSLENNIFQKNLCDCVDVKEQSHGASSNEKKTQSFVLERQHIFKESKNLCVCVNIYEGAVTWRILQLKNA